MRSHRDGKTDMSMLKVVDLLVEVCKDIANCGKLQQVGVGVVQKML